MIDYQEIFVNETNSALETSLCVLMELVEFQLRTWVRFATTLFLTVLLAFSVQTHHVSLFSHLEHDATQPLIALLVTDAIRIYSVILDAHLF